MGFLTPSGSFESFGFDYYNKPLKAEKLIIIKLLYITAKQVQLFPPENKKFYQPFCLILHPNVF